MKHILLATTALVATAGVASANENIALSGSAEMGLIGGTFIETGFHTDIDITFTMTGEADNGLTFGAKVDLDENGAFANSTQGGETLFIAYGPAKLTMGDVDGAFDAAMKEAIIGSAINDDHEQGLGAFTTGGEEFSFGGYNGNSGLDGVYDGQIAQLEYSASGFTGYLSVELDDTDDGGDPIWGVGVRYSADLAGLALGVGLGYQAGDLNGDADDGNVSVWGVSVDTTFNNGIQGILNYSSTDFGSDDDQTHVGVAFGYTMNALTIGVNMGKYENRGGFADLTTKGYGLAVDYDLGGGLQAQFGYGYAEIEDEATDFSDDANSWSLGLAMSF
ncbi:MAG: porin [Pelagimonas sp.]|uniref:porin n=1 Tax=Pelagimonas sp. TaxID=2073170 RepID=UPI003D6BAEE9